VKDDNRGLANARVPDHDHLEVRHPRRAPRTRQAAGREGVRKQRNIAEIIENIGTEPGRVGVMKMDAVWRTVADWVSLREGSEIAG
jgi:hypothetical protein